MSHHKGASIVYNTATGAVGLSFTTMFSLITCPPKNFLGKSMIADSVQVMVRWTGCSYHQRSNCVFNLLIGCSDI
jgi:hypothetical protein